MNTTDNEAILIVDDEENLRRTLTLILQRSGYTVTAAANVSEGRECVQSGRFDLVLLDLKLPDGSGLSLLTELHSKLPALPVLILTAHDKLGVAIEAVTHGARDYLLKPIDPPVLLQRVKEVLEEG